MPLLTTSEIQEMIPTLNNKVGGMIAGWLRKLLAIDKASDLYDRCSDCLGGDFAEKALIDLGIDYSIGNPERIEELDGKPFIAIANHPYGSIDGIIFTDLFTLIDREFKVMVNEILARIEAMSTNFIIVNPNDNTNKGVTAKNVTAIKKAIGEVKEGHSLGIFPSGAVSDYRPCKKIIEDRPWQESIIKLIKKLNVPILPVHFLDHNSMFYYRLGLINWKLRVTRLPAEVFNKAGKQVRISLGKVITPEAQDTISDIKDFSDFLRSSVYDMPVPDTFTKRSKLSINHSFKNGRKKE